MSLFSICGSGLAVTHEESLTNVVVRGTGTLPPLQAPVTPSLDQTLVKTGVIVCNGQSPLNYSNSPTIKGMFQNPWLYVKICEVVTVLKAQID